MSPRRLEVRPEYRPRRLWPWVAGVALLLGLGLWELRARSVPPPVPPSDLASPSASTPPAPLLRSGGGLRVPLPDAPGAGISGRVLTADGQPAPGVTVVVSASSAEARSGDDGHFRLDAPAGLPLRLEAHHSDLGFAEAEVRAPATEVVLRLAPRAGFEVQVLSEGRPVPGASITVQQRGGAGALFHGDRTTDARGTLRFLGLPGGPAEVEAVLAATGARATLMLELREGAVDRATLLLPVTGVVGGRVVTRGGAPVPGAFVGVEEAEGLPARSGEDGRFVLRGLQPGRDYHLTARTSELGLDVPVTARSGQDGVQLVLRDRPVFRGRVVDAAGAPLPVFSVDGRVFRGEDGRFAVPLEPRQGQVEFLVTAEGMLTRTVRTGASLSELGDIPMQPAPRLRGRVKLASGQPVMGAEVSAGPDTTRSDARGEFSLALSEPPAPGTPAFVNATLGDLAGSAQMLPETSADIVLGGESPVRVRVLGPTGAPAAGRMVQLAGSRTYTWTTGTDGVATGRVLAGEYRAFTDAQPGRVWFVRLPREEVLLGASAGAGSLEVQLDSPVEALWVEKGAQPGPVSGDRPGPRGEGQLVFGAERLARFEGLTPGTWTVVGLREGTPVVRTVEVAGVTRLSL